MPILASSGYVTCESVLNRIRMIIADSEVVGGDVLTDTAPMTFDVLNGAFESVQIELASNGIEVQKTTAWLIGLPAMPTLDPEARLIIDDVGTTIRYPNGIGNVYSLVPQLPTDLVVPTRLWERQTNTTNFVGNPMKQCNSGLLDLSQQQYLIDWQWIADGLQFRGATQVQDIKIEYEKHLAPLAAPTDPVPIRGVTNAAAYYGAKIFVESRGGAIAPTHLANATREMEMLINVGVRRKQHKQVRRRPYSGRRGSSGLNI